MGKPKGESRGLAFLTQARPAAIQHLLKFFGESGRHLDAKTRFLISIVTKVINFSPRGLEQYVRRALREGATADEILDAVLCSYPCAGLTRVVDAVDVILDLQLPEFEGLTADLPAPAVPPEREASGGAWHAVAEVAELPVDGALRVVAGRHDLALFRRPQGLYAIDNVCPHKGGFLSQGSVHGSVVSCPLHSWKFELGSGECLHRPGARVRTYPVRVTEAQKIEVRLP